jgi:hypothetical protein
MEKLKNHEFNNQGKLLHKQEPLIGILYFEDFLLYFKKRLICSHFLYRAQSVDKQAQLDLVEPPGRHLSWEVALCATEKSCQ